MRIQSRFKVLRAKGTPFWALSILLSANARGQELLNDPFDADPTFFFQNNGVYSLSAPGPGRWASGQLDSTIFGDIDGEVLEDLENGLVYSDERTRGFVYFLDLGVDQTTYSVGDSFTATVDVAGNPEGEFGNMTANLGVFTSNTNGLRVDVVHPSTTAGIMENIFINEGNFDGGEYEFYEVGATSLTDLGVVESGLGFSAGEGQAIGSEGAKVSFNGTLTLEGTFSETHRYLGIVLISNVGTNSDNTRWIAFDNATISLGAVASSELAITEIELENQSVVLTWNSVPGETYTVAASTDLVTWNRELDDFVNADSEGEQTTESFDLTAVELANEPKLFFRVERNP